MRGHKTYKTCRPHRRGIGKALIRLESTYIGHGAWAQGHSTESRQENGRTFTVGIHATCEEHWDGLQTVRYAHSNIGSLASTHRLGLPPPHPQLAIGLAIFVHDLGIVFWELRHGHSDHSATTQVAIEGKEVGNGRLPRSQGLEDVLREEPADNRTDRRQFVRCCRRDGPTHTPANRGQQMAPSWGGTFKKDAEIDIQQG